MTTENLWVVYTLTSAPPSLNNSYFNKKGGGRAKSKRYMTWIRAAGHELNAQGIKPVLGNYQLEIKLGSKMSRADIDNLIKPISDLLKTMGATEDDSKMTFVSIEKVDRPDLLIRVTKA